MLTRNSVSPMEMPSPVSPSTRPVLAVVIVVGLGAGIGWLWLAGSIAALLATTDMATLGPGMGLFNHLNGLAELPESVRAGLTLLCTPAVGTPWGLFDFATVFLMWVMMVLAMMLPSAAPMLRIVASRLDPASAGSGVVVVTVLALGYLADWVGFAAVATLAQWGLVQAHALSPAMTPMSMVLAGTTLCAAGIYQFTPMKQACLDRCRVPRLATLPDASRISALFGFGLAQGFNCLGCCWALMLAMFAAGVMNVLWIALLGAVMAWEKLGTGAWPSRIIGIGLCLLGAALIAGSPVGTRIWQFL